MKKINDVLTKKIENYIMWIIKKIQNTIKEKRKKFENHFINMGKEWAAGKYKIKMWLCLTTFCIWIWIFTDLILEILNPHNVLLAIAIGCVTMCLWGLYLLMVTVLNEVEGGNNHEPEKEN